MTPEERNDFTPVCDNDLLALHRQVELYCDMMKYLLLSPGEVGRLLDEIDACRKQRYVPGECVGDIGTYEMIGEPA